MYCTQVIPKISTIYPVDNHIYPGVIPELGFSSSVFWVFCEKMSERVIRSKNEQFAHLLSFGERPEQIAHSRSFLVSHLSDSITAAFCPEQSERIAHSRSLKWSILSEWANCQPWVIHTSPSRYPLFIHELWSSLSHSNCHLPETGTLGYLSVNQD